MTPDLLESLPDRQTPSRATGPMPHPQRLILAGEVHARPYEVIEAPLRVSHLAVFGPSEEPERAHLAVWLGAHGAEPPGEGAIHFTRDLGALRLRWERHAEFSTYSFLRFDPPDDPFGATALDLVPIDWLNAIPGQLLAALHVTMVAHGDIDLAAAFEGNQLIGSSMMGGAADGWTDFRLHADGFGRVLVQDLGLTRGQTGRLLQRLLDIETYRMMALLALPPARAASSEIARIDRELGGIVNQLADPAVQQNDRDLLEHLTRLAAEAERLDAATSFRLSAARAYHAIIRSRVEELREERIPGHQTVAEFMARRLNPAMNTCESVANRLDLLSRRVSRVGDLLRTRVDIALEEKNRDLLKSMNRRAHLQLRLQETVEGLSVVAVSYYLLGLLSYLVKGAKAAGLHIDGDLAGLIGLPIIAAMVWLGVRRLRRAIGTGAASD